MKIGGIELTGPNEEVLVLPRLNCNIVIRARAVADMSGFEKLVPEPKPPGKLTKDGWVPTTKDETFLKRLYEYNEQRFAYMVIQSLIPSAIEWEGVQVDNPATWRAWDAELRAAGFADVEINRIIACVMQANSLDERKLKEAREVFLRGLEEEQNVSSGPQTELPSMPSGEVVTA